MLYLPCTYYVSVLELCLNPLQCCISFVHFIFSNSSSVTRYKLQGFAGTYLQTLANKQP